MEYTTKGRYTPSKGLTTFHPASVLIPQYYFEVETPQQHLTEGAVGIKVLETCFLISRI
jgi:hypothetical protein